MTTNAELQAKVERLQRMVTRTLPIHARFANDLVDELDGSRLFDVQHEFVTTQRGPLGGISTRVPIVWSDEDGRMHNIMIQVYADANIDRAFENLHRSI